MRLAIFLLALPLAAADLQWHDARSLLIEGQGWTETKHRFDRLPAKAEGVVPKSVWGLQQNSAGLCVRFMTDSKSIKGRWTLRQANLALPHMPATGVSGLDLYIRDNGTWHWVGAGRPEAVSNEKDLVTGLAGDLREYMLYFPLYNGVESVEIGVPEGAKLQRAPGWPLNVLPVVFYGTSILQGGCASRPGMAYPAILGRKLGVPTINLGFSGSAKSEPALAELMAELDAAVYVYDSLPNLATDEDIARIEPFLRSLRKARPRTPIVLVDNVIYQGSRYIQSRRESYENKNAKLREVYEKMRAEGEKLMFPVAAKDLYGDDDEATVDGAHATDLGFLRMAEAVAPALERALRGAAENSPTSVI